MRLIWTEQGCKSLEFIMTCSQDFYSRTLLRKLNSDIKNAEHLLESNPQIGQLESSLSNRDFEYRHFVLCKPFMLIYFIYNNVIYIADIWDTRQSPSRLTEKIN